MKIEEAAMQLAVHPDFEAALTAAQKLQLAEIMIDADDYVHVFMRTFNAEMDKDNRRRRYIIKHVVQPLAKRHPNVDLPIVCRAALNMFRHILEVNAPRIVEMLNERGFFFDIVTDDTGQMFIRRRSTP